MCLVLPRVLTTNTRETRCPPAFSVSFCPRSIRDVRPVPLPSGDFSSELPISRLPKPEPACLQGSFEALRAACSVRLAGRLCLLTNLHTWPGPDLCTLTPQVGPIPPRTAHGHCRLASAAPRLRGTKGRPRGRSHDVPMSDSVPGWRREGWRVQGCPRPCCPAGHSWSLRFPLAPPFFPDGKRKINFLQPNRIITNTN